MHNYDFKLLFDGTRKILRNISSLNVINISSADSSPQYEEKISNLIGKYSTPYSIQFCPYYFTNSIIPTTLKQIKYQLGVEPTSGITLLSSATLSLNTILTFLKQSKIRRIAIISPYYFISSNICKTLGIKYNILPVQNQDGEIYLPLETILNGSFDAILITSPLYGTCEYFSNRIIDDIELLQSEKKYIILDEALALQGHELSRYLKQNDYIFFIYSPHKSIGINAYKFSVIISSKNNEQILRECAETYAGGLNQTSISAIEHYISNNFILCQEEYLKTINNNKKILTDTLCSLNKQHQCPNKNLIVSLIC